jgi:Bifunctional DNA primase/polymerase, N-terminal/Family of unknown function (DUF5906)
MIPADFAPPDSNSPIDWAIAYAAAGMAVFPVKADKKPLTDHGLKDATVDEAQIRAWWMRWPHADPAWAVPAEILAVDLDVGKGDGVKDFIEREGVAPDDIETPQSLTPRGGRHLLFRANGGTYRNGVRINGSAIDLRTAGGYVVLPGPGNGRTWLKPLSTPVAQAPAWIHPAPAAETPLQAPRPFTGETAYARTALERACLAIEEAPNGEQEATLNKECFSIGGLVGGGELELETAIAALWAAADLMPAYAEPWTGLEEKIRRTVTQGMLEPRARVTDGVSLGDFVAYMQSHDYVFMPAGDFWPAARVDARLPPVKLFDAADLPIIDSKKGLQKQVSASAWLAKHAPVEQLTRAPGEPQLIRHRLVSAGGWADHANATVLNLYRPPRARPGDATKAAPWLDHGRRIYPDDIDQIVLRLAHRVQRPHEKINHGIVLGGPQGIGKDTFLEPVKHAVGPWNFIEVSPQQMLGRFNGFLKCVVLRVSEAKDMGEVDRFKFYDHIKTYLASPPDVLRVDEKNLREHNVFNVCFAIMTTNHKTDGIYLPADDRRHYALWSNSKKEDFDQAYWNKLWGWYEREGFGHVAAYLASLDLSGFDPKAPPPKTEAFWAIVDASRPPEDAELADILDTIGSPDATTILRIADAAPDAELAAWIRDRKNRRIIPHRLEKVGYVPVRNDYADDGLWKVYGKRQAIYAKIALSPSERLRAAKALLAAAQSSA